MVFTTVTIDGEAFIVSHPTWWSKRQIEEWIPSVVQDCRVVECQEIGAVMLGENELPDLAYDEGGQAPIELHMLQKGKRPQTELESGDRAGTVGETPAGVVQMYYEADDGSRRDVEEGEAQAATIQRMNLHALRRVFHEIAGDLEEACAGIYYPEQMEDAPGAGSVDLACGLARQYIQEMRELLASCEAALDGRAALSETVEAWWRTRAPREVERARWEAQAGEDGKYASWRYFSIGQFRLRCRMLEPGVSISNPENGTLSEPRSLFILFPAYEFLYRADQQSEERVLGTISAQDYTLSESAWQVTEVRQWVARYQTYFDEHGALCAEDLAGEERASSIKICFAWLVRTFAEHAGQAPPVVY